jgi:hypothetical protein
MIVVIPFRAANNDPEATVQFAARQTSLMDQYQPPG